jgi:hypothetical protein
MLGTRPHSATRRKREHIPACVLGALTDPRRTSQPSRIPSAAQRASVMDIAVYDLATGTETMITHEGDDVQGTWSPTGARIAYLNISSPTTMWIMDPDGSNPQRIASSTGTADDMQWGDIAWSRDDWILFSVAQNVNGCFKVRTDKIRPDGSSRTQVSDGGPNCTPPGAEQSGDADPGWSASSETIYSSRGFPVPPANGPQAAPSVSSTRSRATPGTPANRKWTSAFPPNRVASRASPRARPMVSMCCSFACASTRRCPKAEFI